MIYPRNMIYHYQTSSIVCDLLLISFVYSVNHLFNHLLIIKITLKNIILFYDLYTVRISFKKETNRSPSFDLRIFQQIKSKCDWNVSIGTPLIFICFFIPDDFCVKFFSSHYGWFYCDANMISVCKCDANMLSTSILYTYLYSILYSFIMI